jgi:hypothetical protein
VKRVELMREAVPLAVRLVMEATRVGRVPQIVGSTEEAARKLSFTVEVVNIEDPSNIAKTDIPPRFNRMRPWRGNWPKTKRTTRKAASVGGLFHFHV